MADTSATTVYKIFLNEDPYQVMEEKDIGPNSLTNYKSILGTPQSLAIELIHKVAKKLHLVDFHVFRLFLVDLKNKKLRLVENQDTPGPLLPNVHQLLALIYVPALKNEKTINTNQIQWHLRGPEKDFCLTHRLLLNDQQFTKFSDLTIQLNNFQFQSFQAIIHIRFPELLSESADFIKKRKERKLPYGNTALTIRFHDNFLTFFTFQQIFDFIYTGCVDFDRLSLEQILLIYSAADKVGYVQLKQTVGSFIEHSVDFYNVYLICKFADDHNLTDLKQFTFNFCFSNWQSCSTSKDGIATLGIDLFQELTIENAKTGGQVTRQAPIVLPPNTVVENFKTIRESMNHADASFLFNSENLHFHRGILAGASPKFANMFLTQQTKMQQFTLHPEVTIKAAFGLLDLIYFGSANMDVISACQLLLYVTDEFELQYVKSYCEKLICKQSVIDVKNVLLILAVTYLPTNANREFLSKTLRHECLLFIHNHFRDINVDMLQAIHPMASYQLLKVFHTHITAKETNIDHSLFSDG